MKRIYILPLILLLLPFTLMSQKAVEGMEKFEKKVEGNAVSILIEGQKKNVETVMKRKFADLKGSKSEKGMTVYRGATFALISAESMLDIYYRVDKEGDGQTKVVMFLSKGYENFLSSKDDAAEITASKSLLESMAYDVRKYELEIAVKAQTSIWEGEVKNQEKLVKDQEKLIKDQEKLEKDIENNKKDQEQNKKDQENQTKKIGEEKKSLDELQKKFDSMN